MQINDIEEELLKFILNDTPGVYVIKGEWGVGKTYFWNKFLAKNYEEVTKHYNTLHNGKKGKISEKFFKDKYVYSYCSLFGVKSLDDLKKKVYFRLGEIPSDKTFDLRRNIKKYSGLFKDIPLFKSVSESLVLDLLFENLQNYLICFDDIERRNSAFELVEYFSLVSYLKYELNCKVIMILNESDLNIVDYNKYKEKFIDYEINFNPTVETCLKYEVKETESYYKFLNIILDLLDVKNIRVIYLIKRFLNSILKLIGTCGDEMLESIVITISLFVCAKYLDNDLNVNIPSLAFLKSIEITPFGDNKGGLSDKEKKWKSILMTIGFYRFDPFDNALLSYVENGYMDKENLLKTVKKIRKEFDKKIGEKRLNKVWSIYHWSFNDNQAEFVESLKNIILETCEYLGIKQLDDSIKLLRDLGENEICNDLIEAYIQVNKGNNERFDTSVKANWCQVIDEEIIEKFSKVYISSVNVKSLRDSMIAKFVHKSYDDIDEINLINASEDKIKEIFLAENSDLLSGMILGCLNTKDGGANKNGNLDLIFQKTLIVLNEIATTSEFNKKRVEKFGVVNGEYKKK